MGPTAAGKTRLVMELAAQLPVSVVNVDASQVYRHLDIGTAKPSLEERARVPHRLIDIRDPGENYSAADFRADALAAIREITAAGQLPLLAGGTMFYFRALERGLPELPSADPGLRAELQRQADEQGWLAMHARLARLDPARAARIHPHDPQRILRALEIITLTGQSASSYGMHGPAPLPFRIIKLALYPEDRSWLHARIAARFQAMLEQGFLDEVRALFSRPGLSPDLPALRTVGYRQANLYLTGKINYDAMFDQAITATRQLAKRQLTWLRAEQDARRFDCGRQDPERAVREALVASLRE